MASVGHELVLILQNHRGIEESCWERKPRITARIHQPIDLKMQHKPFEDRILCRRG
jgi:hypothetical protein